MSVQLVDVSAAQVKARADLFEDNWLNANIQHNGLNTTSVTAFTLLLKLFKSFRAAMKDNNTDKLEELFECLDDAEMWLAEVSPNKSSQGIWIRTQHGAATFVQWWNQVKSGYQIPNESIRVVPTFLENFEDDLKSHDRIQDAFFMLRCMRSL